MKYGHANTTIERINGPDAGRFGGIGPYRSFAALSSDRNFGTDIAFYPPPSTSYLLSKNSIKASRHSAVSYRCARASTVLSNSPRGGLFSFLHQQTNIHPLSLSYPFSSQKEKDEKSLIFHYFASATLLFALGASPFLGDEI